MAESGERFRGIAADDADTEEGRGQRCCDADGDRGEAVAPAPSIPILATEQIDLLSLLLYTQCHIKGRGVKRPNSSTWTVKRYFKRYYQSRRKYIRITSTGGEF